jgi:plastocyanin
MKGKSFAILLIAFCAMSPAFAGGVIVTVHDADGKAVANAVVELVSDTHAQSALDRVASEAIIDQQHETFIPLVSLVRKGGHVIFTNNDSTMHQVYSFSPIKQFQFEIDQGQRSEAVVFDKPGVASIGCNIHDQMITYVYVADSPFAAMTDAKGHVQFNGVPDGAYHANVWHPQLVPGKPIPPQAVSIAETPVSISIAIPLLAGAMPGMKHMHMGKY